MAKIQIGEIEVNYKIDGEGETIVLVHGLGSSLEDWEEQVVTFSRKYRVVRYDVRGHGESSKPKGKYSVPIFANDLKDLILELGLGKVHLVGISMGGWIVFQFCVDYPELVKSAVIVNSGPDLIFDGFEKKKELFMRQVLFRLFSMQKIGEILAPRLFIKPEQENLRQEFIQRWAKNHKPSYLASLSGSVNWSVRDRLPEIDLPVLIVAADEDYGPIEEKEAYMPLLKHGEMVIIEDSRHATPWEQPEKFSQVVLGFINRNSLES